MNVGGVWVVIVVFTILYIIALLQTLSGLLSREPRKKKLHVANVPLHFVHGLVSILLYIDLRRNADHVACPPGSRGLVAGAGIRGCVGIILSGWYFLVGCISGAAPGSFYLIPANLLCIVFLTVSAGLTNTSLPLLLGQCTNLQPEATQVFAFVREASGGDDAVDGCSQVYLVQTLTIFIIALMIVQTIYICRRVGLPTPFRAVVFYTLRLVRPLGWSSHDTFPDLEKGSSNYHICFGRRSECWACYKIICERCVYQRPRSGIKAPRTDSHLENCSAICTKCYLLRLDGPKHRASLAATLHSDDLSLQHHAADCQHIHSLESNPKNIMLCGPCGALGNSEVTDARERKETAAYQLALQRRMHCSYCAAALPRNKKRWWICQVGMHECHWKGHEVKDPSIKPRGVEGSEA